MFSPGRPGAARRRQAPWLNRQSAAAWRRPPRHAPGGYFPGCAGGSSPPGCCRTATPKSPGKPPAAGSPPPVPSSGHACRHSPAPGAHGLGRRAAHGHGLLHPPRRRRGTHRTQPFLGLRLEVETTAGTKQLALGNLLAALDARHLSPPLSAFFPILPRLSANVHRCAGLPRADVGIRPYERIRDLLRRGRCPHRPGRLIAAPTGCGAPFSILCCKNPAFPL